MLKDDWSIDKYRKFAFRLLSQSFNVDNYRRVRVSESFDKFLGKHVNKEYENLLQYSEAGGRKGNTPYVAGLTMDGISPKINLLLGELRGKGIEISVEAHNQAALKRKQMIEAQMRFLSQMQPFYQSAAQFTGIPYGVNENIPKNEEELEEYMNEYKDVYEILMEEAVAENIDKYKYEDTRKMAFLNLLVTNEVHGKNEIRNGYSIPRLVNGLNAIPDLSTNGGEFNDDGQSFMEAYYMSIPDMLEKYKLKPVDAKELIESYDKGLGFQGTRSGSGKDIVTSWLPFETRSGMSGWQDTNYNRVLVVEMEFLSQQKRQMKVTYDQYNNCHVHEYTGFDKKVKLSRKEREAGGRIETKYIQIVRKATIIGGYKLINTGIAHNQIRSFDNPSVSRLNYVSCIHQYIGNGIIGPSMVDRISVLQDLKDYIWKTVSKEITTHIGSVVAIDLAKVPKDVYGTGPEAVKNLAHDAKANKIILYNSSDGGTFRPNTKQEVPIHEVAVTSQTIIMDCLRVVTYIEAEMEKIVGVDKARQGDQGERALSSVTKMNLNQSKAITETYFQAFEGWEKRMYEKHISQIAMCWANNPEKYQNIAARLNIKVPDDFQIDLQDYRVYVRTYPMSRQELQQAALASLNQGNLQFDDYLLILQLANQNFKTALRKFIKLNDKRRKEMMAMRQQELQIEQQKLERDRQLTLQGDLAKIDRQGQWKYETSKGNNDAMRELSILGNQVKDRKTHADFQKEMMKQDEADQ